MPAKEFRINDYNVSVLVIDRLRLDGGAMFGAIPKTLWSKRLAPDNKNRIPLACRLLVLQSADKTILVDSGCGRKWSEKLKEIYVIEYCTEHELHQVVPGVSDLILTHLHFDHGAGAVLRTTTGELALSYPDAAHYINVSHLEHARNPGLREQASYLSENIEPLAQAKLRLTKDGEVILPGISVHQVDGHTHGLQWVLVDGGEQKLAFPADLVPTSHHLQIPYVMGYDLNAECSMREKEIFLNRAVNEGWIVVFEHDPELAAARIGQDDRGRFVVAEPVALPDFS